MELIPDCWFSELEMDDPYFLEQCENMDSFDEEIAAVLGDEFQNCLSSESNSCSSTLIQRSNSTTTLCASPPPALPPEAPAPVPAPSPPPPKAQKTKRPPKQLKANNSTNYLPGLEQPASSPIILNFGNSKVQSPRGQKRSMNPEEEADLYLNSDQEESPKSGGQNEPVAVPPTTTTTKKTTSRVRPPSQTYDHIIAERKRREQLSQLFVALSGLVPGLKKMDKTSVLGDAIKYLKQLQERVQKLEEKATKQTMESVVLVRRSQLVADDEDEGEGSSDENPFANSNESLPEIEARVCDRTVLIRIHCEKYKGVIVKILSEVEKLHLLVTNSSVASFGSLAFEITIVAKMETEFQTTTKGLVRSLRAALGRFRERV